MNSKFFHGTIRWRRLKNEVKGVEVDSQWCEESQIVRREAKLFEKRFTATQDVGVNLGSVEFKTLTLEVNRNMIVSFSKEKVKDTVWQCGGSKNPGSDRFNFNFIQSCWDVIKSDVMAVVNFFTVQGHSQKVVMRLSLLLCPR